MPLFTSNVLLGALAIFGVPLVIALASTVTSLTPGSRGTGYVVGVLALSFWFLRKETKGGK